nr:unnamed protein product [Digitaria exilis]
MATDDVSPMPTAVDGAAEESIITTPWMLLELFAYFKDVENATTAATTTSDKKHIQITFCTRPPPFLSRFYIYSRDGASIRGTPFVLSMEDDLVLIRVAVGGFGGLDYYVYQADDGSGKPSLTLLPKIPDGLYFHPKDIGLLRCRRPGSTGKEYMVYAP